MSRRNTIEVAHITATKRNGKCLSNEYTDNKSKLLWMCQYGHQWTASLHDVKDNNSWCPYCAGLIKHTIEDCHKWAKSKNGKCLSENYNKIDEHLLWECDKGHQWPACFNHIKNNNSWCPECSGVGVKSIEYCREFAISKNGKCLSDEYIGNKSKLQWQCGQCEYVWPASLNQVKDNDTWCPNCAGNIVLSLEECHEWAKSKNGKCLSNEYINANTNIIWQCENNHIWPACFNNIKNQNQWCPECLVRKTQKHLSDLLEKLIGQKCRNNVKLFSWLKYKKRLEIDIWFPDIKLAIEYDGEQHYCPVKFGGMSNERAQKEFEITKTRDSIKDSLILSHIESNGPDIKYFIRFSYLEMNDITEEYIKNKLYEVGVGL